MKILYKYQGTSVNTLTCLINGHVWFSSPKDFNDPFDTALIDSEFIHLASYSYEKIFCLAEKNDNYLMWSHYSNSHKGFCIEFTDYTDDELVILKQHQKFPNVSNDNLTTIRNAKKVDYKTTKEIQEYVKDIPIDELAFRNYFEELKAIGKENELIAKIHHSSFIKHIDWAYEREYRIINTTKHLLYPPGKITSVFFGMHMPPIEKRTIMMILDPLENGACKFFQMFREQGAYALKSRPCDYNEDIFNKMEGII